MYETFNYWFENKDHDDSDQFNKKYFINNIYKQIICNLDIPEDGKIVVAGTHKCVSFDILYKKFTDRCIGYDLYNPSEHPNVIIKNCWELSEKDKLSIAFAHNDIGSYPTTPELKLHTQKWLMKNVIKGGYFLSNNNINSAKYDLEGLMRENGFSIKNLVDLKEFNLQNIPQHKLESYMLCKKEK